MAKKDDPLSELGSMFDDLHAEADAQLERARETLDRLSESRPAAEPDPSRASDEPDASGVADDATLAGQLYGKVSGEGMYDPRKLGYVRGNPSYPKLKALRDRYFERGREAARGGRIREDYPQAEGAAGRPEQFRRGLLLIRDAFEDGVMGRMLEERDQDEPAGRRALEERVRIEKERRRARRSAAPDEVEFGDLPSADCLMWEALERRLALHPFHGLTAGEPAYDEARTDYEALRGLLEARYGGSRPSDDSDGSVGPSPEASGPANVEPRTDGGTRERDRGWIRTILDLMRRPRMFRVVVTGSVASDDPEDDESVGGGASDPDRRS